MKSILDPSFRYTKSVDTDLRKTFARIRREQRLETRKGLARGTVTTILLMKSRALSQR